MKKVIPKNGDLDSLLFTPDELTIIHPFNPKQTSYHKKKGINKKQLDVDLVYSDGTSIEVYIEKVKQTYILSDLGNTFTELSSVLSGPSNVNLDLFSALAKYFNLEKMNISLLLRFVDIKQAPKRINHLAVACESIYSTMLSTHKTNQEISKDKRKSPGQL